MGIASSQSNGNKSYFLALEHHFEAKATATSRRPYQWGTTSRPKQRQQIVHLSAGAPLRNQSNGNKSDFLLLVHRFETKQPPPIVHLSTGAPLRDQINGNKSYFLALGHHFEIKATATNRTFFHWGTTSRPKQRQQIALLIIGAPFRDESNCNKTYFLALGPHFELEATATNRSSSHWGTISRPKQRLHLSAGAPLRNPSYGNKSHFLALGHHFETKATTTNHTS